MNKELLKILKMIAYPRRGTIEEKMDIFQVAEMIQKIMSIEDFEKLEIE